MSVVKEISVKELKSLFDSKSDFQLIDVREPHERDIATLGGDNIPLGTITQHSDKFSRDKQVVIYCRSGKRSGDAALVLQRDFGFQNLYNLKGGILAYSDEIDSSLTKY